MLLALGLGAVGAIAFAKFLHRRRHGHHGCGHGHHGCGHGHHRGHGRRGHRRRWFLYRGLEHIDASPAQERALVAELEQLEAQLRGGRQRLGELRGPLADAFAASELDPAALDTLERGVDAVVAEVRGSLMATVRRVHALLDDGQRARLVSLLGGARRATGPYRA